MAVGELNGDRNPLPAFGCNRLGFGFELFRDETIKQGDVLTPEKIRQTQRDLYATNAFREVNIRTEPMAGDGTSHKVLVDLTEAKPLLFVYGLGYTTDDGGSPRGIPPAMRWRPVTTFFQSLVDMKNAQIPGPYRAWAHDYRADLPRFLSTVYGLPATDPQLTRIEQALQRRETVRERIFAAAPEAAG